MTFINRKDAHMVYKDVIRQIREQNPDQLYLDKALEELLGGDVPDIKHDREEDNDLFSTPKIKNIAKLSKKSKGKRKTMTAAERKALLRVKALLKRTR